MLACLSFICVVYFDDEVLRAYFRKILLITSFLSMFSHSTLNSFRCFSFLLFYQFLHLKTRIFVNTAHLVNFPGEFSFSIWFNCHLEIYCVQKFVYLQFLLQLCCLLFAVIDVGSIFYQSTYLQAMFQFGIFALKAYMSALLLQAQTINILMFPAHSVDPSETAFEKESANLQAVQVIFFSLQEILKYVWIKLMLLLSWFLLKIFSQLEPLLFFGYLKGMHHSFVSDSMYNWIAQYIVFLRLVGIDWDL